MNEAAFYRDLLRKAAEAFPAYPEGRYQGRGIVLCAGGLRHLSNAYVCMKFLREFTNLPIELFFAGEEEMPTALGDQLREDFAPIVLRDITEPAFRADYSSLPVDDFRGFQIKPYALLYASFEEIFYVDADNIPLQSPETLFDSEEYVRNGAIFWPDLKRTKTTSEALFRVFNIISEELKRDFEFETGQIALDKRRCWSALLCACFANSDLDGIRKFCFRHTMGDKDIFRLAFQFAGKAYHLISHPSLRVGNRFLCIPVPLTGLKLKIQHDIGSFYATGMLQHDLSGNPLFLHKTVCEWDVYLDFRNLLYIEDLRGQSRIFPILAEWEDRGYCYLMEFRERYLKFFRKNQLRAFQGQVARWLMNFLDVVLHLKQYVSGDKRRNNRAVGWPPERPGSRSCAVRGRSWRHPRCPR